MVTEEVKEYYKNGTLRYECTKLFLSKAKEHLYDRRIITPSGEAFIRIKHAAKYRKDGTLQWKLIYDEKGEVIPKHKLK